jgi:hypothetical protein
VLLLAMPSRPLLLLPQPQTAPPAPAGQLPAWSARRDRVAAAPEGCAERAAARVELEFGVVPFGCAAAAR